jgi:hypothetical protein
VATSKSGGSSSSALEQRKVRESTGVKGKGVGCSRGCYSLFIGAEEAARGSNGQSNDRNAIHSPCGIKRG